MAEHSAIEWTDHTFNPWLGCTKVGPGCDHCYAETYGKRLGVEWGAGKPRRRTSPANWNKVESWNRKAKRDGTRPRVFCASLSDVFDNEVPDTWREHLWDLIWCTPYLDWIIVTKRIGNAAKMLPWLPENPWRSVWLLATICNQEEAERDIPKLLATPAEVRGISYEPALGPVDVEPWLPHECEECDGDGLGGRGPNCPPGSCPHDFGGARLSWVISGGESGPGARPMHPDWARSVRDHCVAAGVPFFFKQWGECASIDQMVGEFYPVPFGKTCVVDGMIVRRVGKKRAGRLLDGREWNEVPA